MPPVFEYEVVPVAMTRGARGSEADEEWAAVRAGLNELGRRGYRVVAVTDGAEGRAILMERRLEEQPTKTSVSSEEAGAVFEAAEEITRDVVKP